MVKVKKIVPEWHKEWDRQFKNILDKEIFIEVMGIRKTANDMAKEFIERQMELVRKDLFDRHNLLALSFYRIANLNEDRKRIRDLINKNIKRTDELKKQLLSLLCTKHQKKHSKN
jgi:hypothetical protein